MKVFEGVVEFESEDGGMALIAHIPDRDGNELDYDKPSMFVRIHSWDETGVHAEARKFEGKRVQVILEKYLNYD